MLLGTGEFDIWLEEREAPGRQDVSLEERRSSEHFRRDVGFV